MIRLRSYWPCLFAEGKRAVRFSSRLPSLSILGWRSTIGSGGPCSSPAPYRALVRGLARRQLERREVDVGHEFLLPQELADGQEVPVIQVRRARGCQGSAGRQRALLFCPDVILERIAHDILKLSPVEGRRRIKCSEAGRAHHGVVELPVLVAHRRGIATLVVEEVLAIRLFRLASEVVDLVEPIELGLH